MAADGALHRRAGGDALLREERLDAIGVKCLFVRHLKIRGIIKEHEPIDTPHIILEIRIVKCHSALLHARWKAAHHHDRRIFRQERREGAQFDFLCAIFHPIPPIFPAALASRTYVRYNIIGTFLGLWRCLSPKGGDSIDHSGRGSTTRCSDRLLARHSKEITAHPDNERLF